jgi:hypothetical protein
MTSSSQAVTCRHCCIPRNMLHLPPPHQLQQVPESLCPSTTNNGAVCRKSVPALSSSQRSGNRAAAAATPPGSNLLGVAAAQGSDGRRMFPRIKLPMTDAAHILINQPRQFGFTDGDASMYSLLRSWAQ